TGRSSRNCDKWRSQAKRKGDVRKKNSQAIVVYVAYKRGENLVQELVEITVVFEMIHVEPPDIAEENGSAQKKKDMKYVHMLGWILTKQNKNLVMKA
ncbi:hypothetical protein HAX54_026263, partial [Datura stramonium]|nr:hypothetical protein [Datura stramonium]